MSLRASQKHFDHTDEGHPDSLGNFQHPPLSFSQAVTGKEVLGEDASMYKASQDVSGITLSWLWPLCWLSSHGTSQD